MRSTPTTSRVQSRLWAEIESLPPLIPKAMNNLQRLSTVIADRREQFGSMLKTMDLVTNTLRRQRRSIGSMVNQGQQLLGEFVMRRAAFPRDAAVDEPVWSTFWTTPSSTTGRVGESAGEHEHALSLMAKHDDMVRSVLQSAPVALRGLANATGTGNALDTNFSTASSLTPGCVRSAGGPAVRDDSLFQDCK